MTMPVCSLHRWQGFPCRRVNRFWVMQLAGCQLDTWINMQMFQGGVTLKYSPLAVLLPMKSPQSPWKLYNAISHCDSPGIPNMTSHCKSRGALERSLCICWFWDGIHFKSYRPPPSCPAAQYPQPGASFFQTFHMCYGISGYNVFSST